MKKSFLTMLFVAVALLFGVASCKCTSDVPTDAAGLVLENTVSTDREDMFLNHGPIYVYFESTVVLKNFLDEEECDGSIESITNVFQTIREESETVIDTDVVIFTHTEVSDSTQVIPHEMWLEDCKLDDEEINLTFAEAYERFMEADCPKPHSQYAVLRKPIGPEETNALYIFGNEAEHWFVDAKTGDVFSEDPGFEWFKKD